MKFAKIIKIDTYRGNLCTSKRAVEAEASAVDKEILSKYNWRYFGKLRLKHSVFWCIFECEGGL